MAKFEIWHNPRCSKSRQTLALLESAGHSPTILRYLEDPPSEQRLKEVLALLGFEDPRQLMRTQEAAYREQGLADQADPATLIAAMARTPALIERPVVIKDGTQAVLGRPPEQVADLIAD